MTGRVFISYRREDSSGYARAVYNELRGQLGPNNIFMDVDTIEPGVDFIKAIESAVGRCDILLALIGPHWLDSGEGEVPRLHSENDYVRTEIATALRRDIRVVPLLVGDAVMPLPANLPEDIVPLTRRNALEIRHSHFDADVARLTSFLVKLVNPEQEEGHSSSPEAGAGEKSLENAGAADARTRKQQWIWRIAVLLLFTLMGIVYFALIDDLRVRSSSGGYSTVRPDDALVLAIVTVLLALLITTVATLFGRKRRWLSVVIGMLAFAALGFGIAVFLGEIRVSGDGPLVGAVPVWVVGFVAVLGPALWRRRGENRELLKNDHPEWKRKYND